MRIISRLILLITLSVFLSCNNSTDRFLIGSWSLSGTKDNIESDDLLISLSPIKETSKKDKRPDDVILTFENDTDATIVQYGESEKVKYKRTDNKLIIGLADYKIVKLTKDSLVLTNEGIMTLTYTYIKR